MCKSHSIIIHLELHLESYTPGYHAPGVLEQKEILTAAGEFKSAERHLSV